MQTKFKIKPVLDVDVSEQDINDIMRSITDKDYTHWWSRCEQHGPVAAGGKAVFFRDGHPYKLTRAMLLDGIRMFIENGNAYLVEDEELDTKMIVGDGADAVLQYALFGEIVFEKDFSGRYIELGF